MITMIEICDGRNAMFASAVVNSMKPKKHSHGLLNRDQSRAHV
jgi:hypothetical protein